MPIRMVILKIPKDKWSWECRGSWTLIGTLLNWWECTMVQSLWKTLWMLPTKLKIEIWTSKLTLGTFAKEPKSGSRRDSCTPRHLQYCSHLPRYGNNLSVNQQMKRQRKHGVHKQWNIMQPLKKEILKYVTIWMNTEDNYAKEIGQSPRDKYYRISSIWDT